MRYKLKAENNYRSLKIFSLQKDGFFSIYRVVGLKKRVGWRDLNKKIKCLSLGRC